MVVIEGLKMPKSCQDCPLRLHAAGAAFGTYACAFHKQWVDDLYRVRHDMCPLREVKEEGD